MEIDEQIRILENLKVEMESAYYGGYRVVPKEDELEAIEWAVAKLKKPNVIVYVNDDNDDERALYNLDTMTAMISGDEDMIPKTIGYMLALGIDPDCVKAEYIDSYYSEGLFRELGFHI